MKKRDIVLAKLGGIDEKNVPVLILKSTADQVTAAIISSQLSTREESDFYLKPSSETGIKKDALIKVTKLITIQKSNVVGKLGILDTETMKMVSRNLKKQLNLNASPKLPNVQAKDASAS